MKETITGNGKVSVCSTPFHSLGVFGLHRASLSATPSGCGDGEPHCRRRRPLSSYYANLTSDGVKEISATPL
jgi:hypothetical protein